MTLHSKHHTDITTENRRKKTTSKKQQIGSKQKRLSKCQVFLFPSFLVRHTGQETGKKETTEANDYRI